MSTHLQQQIVLNAGPEAIYRSFMDEGEHSALTGGTSRIDSSAGGLADMHDGQIVARNIELEPGRRIVQAWRVTAWEPGVYTLLRLDFLAEGDATRVKLDQTGCPEGTTEHLAQGWEQRYWQPLAKKFSRP